MKNIIIHQSRNFKTQNYRYYNIFFDNFCTFLNLKFNCIENRYFIDAERDKFPIKLLSDSSENTFSNRILECELIIENYDTKEIKMLSVADQPSEGIISIQNYENVSDILVSQFDREFIYAHIQENNRHKYKPWVYFPCNDFNFDVYREERNKLPEYINKFYFRGTDLENRSILNHFNSTVFEGGLSIHNTDLYFRDLLKYKIGLSVGGRGELCYRDIEYMAIGIPFLRFYYKSELNPPLVPDYHYIGVPRPTDLHSDKSGNKIHAQLLIDKFNEVKDNIEYLNFISTNARKYYEDYLSPVALTNHTYNILNMNAWE